ncbi:MAG: hypothetical protein EA368_18590 [Leptolyngbya sp. DLM2.Bin27]|nr:MAG: hypothetical protein EA368_18590 [Leptolyngbya sp. DLM2.Bin27]
MIRPVVLKNNAAYFNTTINQVTSQSFNIVYGNILAKPNGIGWLISHHSCINNSEIKSLLLKLVQYISDYCKIFSLSKVFDTYEIFNFLHLINLLLDHIIHWQLGLNFLKLFFEFFQLVLFTLSRYF